MYSAAICIIGLMWMCMYYHSCGLMVAKNQKNLYSLVSVQTSSSSPLKIVASSVSLALLSGDATLYGHYCPEGDYRACWDAFTRDDRLGGLKQIGKELILLHCIQYQEWIGERREYLTPCSIPACKSSFHSTKYTCMHIMFTTTK